MNRRMLLGLACSFVGILAGAANGQDAASDADLKTLEGTWVAKAGPNNSITLTLKVNGRNIEFTLTTPGGAEPRTLKGELELDASKSPKQMDWVHMKHEDRELPDRKTIYAFEDDNATLRVDGGPADERPSDFAKVEDGKPTSTLVFKREKKEEPKNDAK